MRVPLSSNRAVAIAAAAPLVFVAAWCTLLRAELVSPLAPLLGPWAGYLYGHADCTMAHAAPELTATAVAMLVGAVAAVVALPERARWLRPIAAGAASLVWSAAALMSVVNTTS